MPLRGVARVFSRWFGRGSRPASDTEDSVPPETDLRSGVMRSVPPFLPTNDLDGSAFGVEATPGFGMGAAPVGLDALAENEVPVPEAPPPSEPGTPLLELVRETFTQCRNNVLSRIQSVNAMTAREVIAVGDSLQAIVGRAQAQVGATRDTLKGLSGQGRAGVAEIIERQTQMVTTHLSTIHAALEQQTELTRQALVASSGIAAIGEQVSKVALQTRLLSLNANVEAARLGANGAGFEVIASQMRRLTDEIDQANRQIGQMAQALLVSLPQIQKHGERLNRSAEAFSKDLAENSSQVYGATAHLKTSLESVLARGDHEAGLILQGSYEAISHLQFQDPTAQSLLIIDADLARLMERVTTLLEASRTGSVSVTNHSFENLEAAESHPELHAGEVVSLGSEPLATGDVMLF
ncbi:MAG TPA: methyl-accepting chemotaxis protein [Polyangiaceae bacterium]|nr:methyl-accepting chemotaxis protein [Polyangiaceae bacterium]